MHAAAQVMLLYSQTFSSFIFAARTSYVMGMFHDVDFSD